MPEKSKDIQNFILENVSEYPDRVIELASKEFDLTRQAISLHVRNMVDQGLLVATGSTRNRKYKLVEPKKDS